MGFASLVIALISFILAALDVKVDGHRMEPWGLVFLTAAFVFGAAPPIRLPWRKDGP